MSRTDRVSRSRRQAYQKLEEKKTLTLRRRAEPARTEVANRIARPIDRYERPDAVLMRSASLVDGGARQPGSTQATPGGGKSFKTPAPLSPEVEQQIDDLFMVEADREEIRAAARGEFGVQAQTETVQTLEAVQDLPPEAQASVLQNIAIGPTSMNAGATVEIVSSPAWEQMSVEERVQLTEVMEHTNLTGLMMLDELTDDAEILLSEDTGRGSLLSNLHGIATQAPHEALTDETTSDEVLTSVLSEITRPYEKVNQSVYGTCTVTSMQFELARDQPAEYARLIRGLAGSEGRVQMAGGGELTIQQEYYDANVSGDSRSPSEILFQSAAMEYANGDDDYDASNDQSTNKRFWLVPDETYRGLNGEKQVRIASQLFGREYTNIAPDSDEEAQEALELLERFDSTGDTPPAIVGVRMGDDDDPTFHAMTFDRVEDGKVYFRNPWGPGTSEPLGLTVEDPDTGLYSMTVEEFRDRVTGVRMPTDIAEAGGNVDPGESNATEAPLVSSTTSKSSTDDPEFLRMIRMRHLFA